MIGENVSCDTCIHKLESEPSRPHDGIIPVLCAKRPLPVWVAGGGCVDHESNGELATIDENIRRVNLTEAQYGKQLKRRKEIYEALHPETKRGGDRRSKAAKSNSQNENLKTPSFTEDTAAKTGRGRSSVARDIALAEKLDDQAVETLGRSSCNVPFVDVEIPVSSSPSPAV